jgi:hypothetical protein
MGMVADLTGNLLWGMLLTLPYLLVSGLLFCLGAPHLAGDQEAVILGLQKSGRDRSD